VRPLPATPCLVTFALAFLLSPVIRADTAAPAPMVLHLDEAVEKALLVSNPTILSAQANVSAAQGSAEQTRSGLLPQLNASAIGERTYGLINRSGTGNAVAGAAGSVAYNTFTFSLNGTQLIWDFQTVDRTRSAYQTVSSFQDTEQATIVNTVLKVRTAFFQAQAYLALVKVQQETLDNEIKHQAQTEGFVKVGTQPEIALAQARTDVDNAKVALIQALNNYRISKATLNQAMGVIQTTNYEVAGEELPVLAETGVALDHLGPAWDFGLQITWNFFDGLKTPGLVRQAQANLDNANASLTAEELQVRFDVEQADATLLASKEALLASQDALVNAKEQLRLAEQRYATGVGSIIELSDAQVAATSAGAQLVQARFTLATARAQLLAALGRR
jgi:outer membrane protein